MAQFEKQNFDKQNLQPQFSNQELSAVRETPELHYGMCSINSASPGTSIVFAAPFPPIMRSDPHPPSSVCFGAAAR